MSSDSIVANNENSQTEFTAREYQVDILEKALIENTIVYLPTGSGKTFIALMLIKAHIEQLQSKYSQGGKRVFFLVNTTPLVKQQAEAVRNILSLEVGEFSGDSGVDFWDGDRWKIEQDKNQVLVMTAQVFLDMILLRYTEVSQICLIIFDECHHAVHKHPMRQIMQELEKTPYLSAIKILGLTATILNANVKPSKVKSELETLEATFHAKIVRAVNRDMVLQYSTNPEEYYVYFEEEDPYPFCVEVEVVIKKLLNIISVIALSDLSEVPLGPPNAKYLNEIFNPSIRKVELNLKDIMKISTELGLFGTDISLLSLVILIERLKINSNDDLYRILCTIETSMHHLRKKIDRLMGDNGSVVKPLYQATDKVLQLTKILSDFSEGSRAIVFVDRRSTAHSLYHIFWALSKASDSFRNIKPNYVIGVNQSEKATDREHILSRKRNKIIMTRFNSGELNVLFASNVIEEGVDIQTCNLVIKFDMPTTFRSYIQSKGRARNKNSKYIVIAPRPNMNKQSFKENLTNFQHIENCLNQILCHENVLSDVQSSNEDDDDKQEFVNQYGSKVTALSAISLINRYCCKLPQDKFSNLAPNWWVKEEIVDRKKMHIGYLQLPINSSLKGIIEGIPAKSKSSAKRLVALEVCRRLYNLGEFDRHFIPVGHKSNLLDDPAIFPKWKNNYFESKLTKAMKRNRRYFSKHYSKWECNCRPHPEVDIFMHIIKITPNYPYPETNRLQAFYNLLQQDSTFCVLTTCPWPELPEFPLFMNVGEVKIEILQNNNFVTLTKENIVQLRQFQTTIFTDGLSLLKAYSIENEVNNKIDEYMIAPVIFENEMFNIDWLTVSNQKEFPEIKRKPFEKRLENPVTEDMYHMKVVIPWYRGENLKYIVTNVRTDLSPESEFPSSNFTSYAHYFLNRYNEKIYDHTQPLLEVRAISSKINCLQPRNSGKKKKEDDGYEETLIPELCYLISFPAIYILKLTLLPSALHRVHHLLLAEELRQTIADDIKVGSMTPSPYNAKWRELRVDKLNNSCDDDNQFISFNPDLMDSLTPSCISNSNNLNQEPWDTKERVPMDIFRDIDIDLTAILHYSKYVDRPLDTLTDLESTKVESTAKKLTLKKVEPLSVIRGSDPRFGPEPADIAMALTAACANDIFNYERAELLGDSFLKFATSLALFTTFPSLDEGKLTQIKGKIVGNMNLFFCGLSKNLPGYLKVNMFDVKDWKVPGYTLSSKLKPYLKDPSACSSIIEKVALSGLERKSPVSDSTLNNILSSDELNHCAEESETINDDEGHVSSEEDDWLNYRAVQSVFCKDEYLMKHLVPEKLVSDSVEALLSVYVQNFGIEGGFKLLKWMSILPETMLNIDELLTQEPVSPLISLDNNVSRILPNSEVEEVESSLGYTFNNKSFLLQALTHSSHCHGLTDCYQRFEFLGDAILDFLLTAYIFEHFKDMNPGKLTDLRSALVNNNTFACIAVRHRFHTHLLSKACKLTDLIGKFAKYQQDRNHKIDEEVMYLIEEPNVSIAEHIDVPKVLGDLFESLVGAIYLDSNRNLDIVWTIIFNIMHNEIETFSKDIPKNAIRMLYEKFVAVTPTFGNVEVKEGVVIIPLEVVHDNKHKIFHGAGDNKQTAKLAAAKSALRYFKC